MNARLTLEVGHHQAATVLPDEVRGCVSLWAEVLRLAVDDARGGGCMPTGVTAVERPVLRTRMRAQARAWLTNDDQEVGTFLWICSLLDLEPVAVRAALAPELEAPPP